jgi:hypothetical protein
VTHRQIPLTETLPLTPTIVTADAGIAGEVCAGRGRRQDLNENG